MVAQLSLWEQTGMGRNETWEKTYTDMFKIRNISKLAKFGKCLQTKTNYVLARQVMQSENYAPTK